MGRSACRTQTIDSWIQNPNCECWAREVVFTVCCPPSYRKMKKLQKYVQLQFATDIQTQRWGGQCTLYTPWEKKQLQKTKFTALMEKSPAANRKEMIQVQRTYPASNWQKESTVQPKKKKTSREMNCLWKSPNPKTRQRCRNPDRLLKPQSRHLH